MYLPADRRFSARPLVMVRSWLCLANLSSFTIAKLWICFLCVFCWRTNRESVGIGPSTLSLRGPPPYSNGSACGGVAVGR